MKEVIFRPSSRRWTTSYWRIMQNNYYMEATQIPSYRYPGTKPFEATDYSLFKGRDEDIQNLVQKLLLQNLIVLYGRSGLGKSSLLNAGLLNHLEETGDMVPLVIRFGAFLPAAPAMPLEKMQA